MGIIFPYSLPGPSKIVCRGMPERAGDLENCLHQVSYSPKFLKGGFYRGALKRSLRDILGDLALNPKPYTPTP